MPQERSTNCSPRLNTFVCEQPTRRGAAPVGRVPLTLSTYRPSVGLPAAFVAVPVGAGPRTCIAFVATFSCEVATGICTNSPVCRPIVLIRIRKLTWPANVDGTVHVPVHGMFFIAADAAPYFSFTFGCPGIVT